MSDTFAASLREALSRRPARKVRVEGARDAAVLVPILAVPEPILVFTVRSDDLPSHKGQISFPGGSIDPDDTSEVHAALREAHEELSLDPEDVEILGEMDAMPTFVTGFVIHPVVGWIEDPKELRPNPGEVAEVLYVPVGDIQDGIRLDPGFTRDGRTYPTEAWDWNGHLIWGATARVVRSLFEHLDDAGLAPAPSGEPWRLP